MVRRAVYTALIGGYEALVEQPLAAGSDVDFICFTDDPDLTSQTWQIRQVDALLPLDPVRSARWLKIEGHPDLAAYDETLWIDARIRLRKDPAAILDDWLANDDFALPLHSFRDSVVAEFEVILQLGMDDSSRLYEQLTHYTSVGPERLASPVLWTALLARRRTEPVARAMREWIVHVLRYSRRDQLSVVEALGRAGLKPRLVTLDNHESDLHEWVAARGRDPRLPIFTVSASLQPPVAAIGELQQRLVEARADAAKLRRENAALRREAAEPPVVPRRWFTRARRD